MNAVKEKLSNFIIFHYFTENGFKNVRFHKDANSHHFSTEDEIKIKETVANIVGCSIEDVRAHGYLYSTSFFIVFFDQRNLH